MSPQVDQVFAAALPLPDEDQLRLLDALAAAVDEKGLRPFDDSWLAEIERRSDEFDAGSVQPIPWDAVKDRARQAAARETGRG
jgi:putative addiction module component (TIGR02574 family)